MQLRSGVAQSAKCVATDWKIGFLMLSGGKVSSVSLCVRMTLARIDLRMQ